MYKHVQLGVEFLCHMITQFNLLRGSNTLKDDFFKKKKKACFYYFKTHSLQLHNVQTLIYLKLFLNNLQDTPQSACRTVVQAGKALGSRNSSRKTSGMKPVIAVKVGGEPTNLSIPSCSGALSKVRSTKEVAMSDLTPFLLRQFATGHCGFHTSPRSVCSIIFAFDGNR